MPIVLPVKDINKRCKYVIMGPLFPLLQVSAAQRTALSDGGRRDPSRTEAPPPTSWPDIGHPSSHHGLLCGQECQCFGLPLSVNHPLL